jgi:hypothetical protein
MNFPAEPDSYISHGVQYPADVVGFAFQFEVNLVWVVGVKRGDADTQRVCRSYPAFTLGLDGEGKAGIHTES